MSPKDYWLLTEGETAAKVRGFIFNRAYEADNIRSLYTLMYNINVRKGSQKRADQLWPLVIDFEKKGKELSHEEIVERNKRIREMSNN